MSLLPIFGEVAGALGSSAVNVWQAERNRDFQERMANTAHQREVADLRKAGLNPILSAMRGSGAATPAGSVGTVENPARGVSSAYQQKKLNDQLLRINEERWTKEGAKLDAEIMESLSRTEVNEETATRIKKEIDVLGDTAQEKAFWGRLFGIGNELAASLEKLTRKWLSDDEKWSWWKTFQEKLNVDDEVLEWFRKDFDKLDNNVEVIKDWFRSFGQKRDNSAAKRQWTWPWEDLPPNYVRK